jgi:hypothetical protein
MDWNTFPIILLNYKPQGHRGTARNKTIMEDGTEQRAPTLGKEEDMKCASVSQNCAIASVGSHLGLYKLTYTKIFFKSFKSCS